MSSPLSEARVESIDDLMSRNPELLGPEDKSRIILFFREARARWELGEKAGKAPKEPKKAAPKNLSLSDLGL